VRTALALFTRDLRLHDNPVLAAAVEDADRVVPLFVLDDAALAGAHGRPNRFGFLCESLQDLDVSLRARGGALFVRRGDWVDEVLRVAKECDAATVHLARDVSGYARRRLARLSASGTVDVVTHDGITVVAPDAFGKPMVMFTPYYNRWLQAPFREAEEVPEWIDVPAGLPAGDLPKAAPPRAWQGGETAALAHFASWPNLVGYYDGQRDAPGADATSRLSPYLHFGCISPSLVADELLERPDAGAFLRELCWRDFFAQLLFWRPELAHDDLRPTAAPRWRDAPGDVEAWKRGRTGFPLVDAGMRQLRADGWMHNRVRMVTASFLTKDLRVDWREGAAHFMDLLVDGDVASNQLNWQWVAGTGTDANPFRVLNPTTQARNHDPEGTYIRKWIDELRDVPGDVDIHDPPFDIRRACGYPEPIIDHAEAIEQWRESRG
jgi:deoxyribodipyrimidine photo-lyase